MLPDCIHSLSDNRRQGVNMLAASEDGKAAVARERYDRWNSGGNQCLAKWNRLILKLAIEETNILLAHISVPLHELHHLLADNGILRPRSVEKHNGVLLSKELVQMLVTCDLDHGM